MNTAPLRALVLGEAGPGEFQRVTGIVRRHVAADSLCWAADVSAFRQATASGWWPDLVIVLQAWPDQFSADEVEALIELCPLARILCCFGPWCDSDGRTRSLWPLGVRVHAASFESRFEHELALLDGIRDVCPPLPLTASRTEIFDFDFAQPAIRRRVDADVSVISPDRRFRDMIAAALQYRGVRAGNLGDASGPAAIVFDADPWDSQRAKALTMIRTTHPQSQVIACVGFSRPHVESELRDAGADAVWFKLAPLADLIEQTTAN